jgi:acyl-CoA reductase-like NAD-dependent aldehyde dehydrogenase
MTTALETQLSTYRWSSQDEADRFGVEDPATGEVITLVQGGGTAEVNAAVEAAHRAFQTDWRWRTPAERAALLLKGADVLAEHADELALLESRENGKPVADARSSRSTGRRSTPTARWRPPSRPATPSSSSRASRHRSPCCGSSNC